MPVHSRDNGTRTRALLTSHIKNGQGQIDNRDFKRHTGLLISIIVMKTMCNEKRIVAKKIGNDRKIVTKKIDNDFY